MHQQADDKRHPQPTLASFSPVFKTERCRIPSPDLPTQNFPPQALEEGIIRTKRSDRLAIFTAVQQVCTDRPHSAEPTRGGKTPSGCDDMPVRIGDVARLYIARDACHQVSWLLPSYQVLIFALSLSAIACHEALVACWLATLP
ncbi:hypothetical protein PoB_002625700 [Plakobranchus ocellatus]|uniref:Uncharacterized protein n=1 Tax=Plakobranchus ocellatus TaxID=259542 RepID=A0AAV3ZXE5_9GAST|nr:hypothetical protein PoB_002625700 [Plakobranchus ocellatus]